MTGKPGAAIHRWTDEERAYLAEIAQGRSHEQIREMMTERFGDHFGGTRISGALKRYGIKTGLTGRFEKGCEGGWRSEEHRRAFIEGGKATRFKKGDVRDRPDGWLKPVGYERVDRDGYTWVKVRDSRVDGIQRNERGRFNENYRMKHHVVWEQEHGTPVPPHTMIVFADRDKANFDPGNLVAVPRSLWATISHRGIQYHDAESLRAAMAVAQIDRAVYAAERAPRPCRRCGGVFEPRYNRQRTCDKCLGRKHSDG